MTELAMEYYDKCEAKAKSGKTVWIGIEGNEQEGKWQVNKNH